MSYKTDLKDRWSAFCRSHFRNSLDLAVTFSVTEQTARNWLDGSHAPAGWVVNMAWSAMPAQVAPFLRLVVDNPAAERPKPAPIWAEPLPVNVKRLAG